LYAFCIIGICFFERKPWGNTPGNRRNILKEEAKLQEKGTYNRPNQRLGNERGLSKERSNRKDYRG
jgi:hypothetical protein